MGTVRAINIGIDIGQKHDPTAIAVAEQQVWASGGRYEERYLVRFLERLPLNTPYPAVAERLGQIVGNAWQAASREEFERTGDGRVNNVDLRFSTYVDATGVGQPVVDILQESGLAVTPVYFTHGDRRTVERGRVTLGKAHLVSRLKALFQTRRIELPRTHPEAEAMRNELINYEIKVDQNANDKYGAFRTGAHDDLVTAVGLAVQDDAALDARRTADVLGDLLAYQTGW
jgi:hypothetical protein